MHIGDPELAKWLRDRATTHVFRCTGAFLSSATAAHWAKIAEQAGEHGKAAELRAAANVALDIVEEERSAALRIVGLLTGEQPHGMLETLRKAVSKVFGGKK